MAAHLLSKYIENLLYALMDPYIRDLQYATQSPGTHIRNDTSRVYVTPKGKAYKYTLNNTPVERGNWDLFLRATRLRFAQLSGNRLTVGDALNIQARDKDYVRKYKQHLLKQHQNGHLTYAGLWQYHPEMFDQIMNTPMHQMLRWNTPETKKYGAHYSELTNAVHVMDNSGMSATPAGVSVVSKRPVTPNAGASFTGLRSGDVGGAIGHLLNHWIHFGGHTAINDALLFERNSYGLAGSPSGKLRTLLSWQCALDPWLASDVDPYSQVAPLILQMNSAYTRGKYALLQKLKKYPKSKAWSQFDQKKLQQIRDFPLFIDLDNGGLQQFRKLMQFWQLNPLLALMLGILAMRAVGSYNELRNAHQQLGAPVGSSHALDADRKRIQDSINLFLSYRHLGANDKKQVIHNLRSKYGIQYNERLMV